jgi:hypothetical protein
MKKPKTKKTKKSTLTLKLEGGTLEQLKKIKEISGEKTSAGAIRYAIELLPNEYEELKRLEKRVEALEQWLELKDEAVRIIMENVKTLTKKNKI